MHRNGIVRGRPRKESAPPPPILVGENTQSDNPDMPDKTEAAHSETPKETDDTNDHDGVPMNETPLNGNRDASHIKSKSSVDTADGMRQRLKFDGEASGMTQCHNLNLPNDSRSQEIQGDCQAG